MEQEHASHNLVVSGTPYHAYQSINRVSTWWTADLEGITDEAGQSFTVRFGETWITLRVEQLVPAERIEWLVTDCHKHFLKDPKEWVGTRIVFELVPEADRQTSEAKTRIRFTHYGLVPELECFSVCDQVWGDYLRNMVSPDFTTSIRVSKPASEVFAAVNDPRAWWSEEIKGTTDQLNSIFDYHFQDVHRCKMRIIELVPDSRVVWEVLENHFKFTQDQQEWVGTRVVFEFAQQQTDIMVTLTHEGLLPGQECYEICRDAWTSYVQGSLKDLITKGKGKPNGLESPQTDKERELSAT